MQAIRDAIMKGELRIQKSGQAVNKDGVIKKYQEAVATYLKNGETDFQRGLVIGIESVLEAFGATPFEIVRLYNEVVKDPDSFGFTGYYGHWTSEVIK